MLESEDIVKAKLLVNVHYFLALIDQNDVEIRFTGAADDQIPDNIRGFEGRGIELNIVHVDIRRDNAQKVLRALVSIAVDSPFWLEGRVTADKHLRAIARKTMWLGPAAWLLASGASHWGVSSLGGGEDILITKGLADAANRQGVWQLN